MGQNRCRSAWEGGSWPGGGCRRDVTPGRTGPAPHRRGSDDVTSRSSRRQIAISGATHPSRIALPFRADTPCTVCGSAGRGTRPGQPGYTASAKSEARCLPVMTHDPPWPLDRHTVHRGGASITRKERHDGSGNRHECPPWRRGNADERGFHGSTRIESADWATLCYPCGSALASAAAARAPGSAAPLADIQHRGKQTHVHEP